jgi:gliding motility-associated-like protein
VTNTAGCSDSIVSVIQALSKAIEPIAVPTGFSPNGDGGNDVLHVLGGPFESVDFKIFNGWGNLIYSTTDPKGGWDGTYQGTAQPVGVYVYTVTGKTIDGKNIKMSGNVTLIR